MRYEATINEWSELYEIALRIKEMKPWEKLYDLDLITIIFDENSEPVMCSIMGKGGDFYGIGVYIGLQAIHDFFLMLESEKMPPDQKIRYQRCIMCNFGDREELRKDEYEIIKKLGLKFRGRNNWIYFRVFDPIYAPYMPDKNDVLQMTKILNQLYFALEALNNGFKVNFEKGKTLLRKFDKESNSWINQEFPVIIPKADYPVPLINDEILIKRLRTQKANKAILDLDIVHLNSIINDKKYDKPLAMRMCIMSDRKTGMVLSQHVLAPEDDEVIIMNSTLINYVLSIGIPKVIYVRDRYIHSIMKDLCQKLKIDLKISQQLHAIDFFVQEFANFNF